eukprot:11659612-Alexandrium_andersonii.AAC.1
MGTAARSRVKNQLRLRTVLPFLAGPSERVTFCADVQPGAVASTHRLRRREPNGRSLSAGEPC